MLRLWPTVLLLMACATASGSAQTTSAPPPLKWQAIADCAAAYRANWQNRRSGYNRSNDMSDMIQAQADDYKNEAVRLHQQNEKSSPDVATKKVAAHIATLVDRYVAMDKAGTLEAMLESCPQLEPEAPK